MMIKMEQNVRNEKMAVIIYRKSKKSLEAADILSRRLGRMGVNKKLIISPKPLKTDQKKALKSCGYKVIDFSWSDSWPLCHIFLWAITGRYLLFIDLNHPFIDSELSTEMLQAAQTGVWSCVKNVPVHVFTPMAVMKRKAAFILIVNKMFQGFLLNLSIGHEKRFKRNHDQTFFQPSAIDDCFTLDTYHPEAISMLGGELFSFSHLRKKQRESFFVSNIIRLSRTRLHEDLQNSSSPHVQNMKLASFEFKHGLKDTFSYPTDVAFNISTLCNANCMFCDYRPIKHSEATFITLSQFKQMTYLKYIKKVGLGGNIGDPLANPEFLEIFQYIEKKHPHLNIRLITNGIGLDKAMCEAFAGKLSRLRISLNTTTDKSWRHLMRARGFDIVCEHIRYLSRLKKAQKTHLPEIILCMVVNKETIFETDRFVELADKLGADAVSFSHFNSGAMPDCQMPHEFSLYNDPHVFDAQMEKVEKTAKELGINIFGRPPDFSDHSALIFEGCRDKQPPKHCRLPWYQAMITPDKTNGKHTLAFCCFNTDTHIDMSESITDYNQFLRQWNHTLLQNVRKDMSPSPQNAVCLSCRKIDTLNPKNRCFEKLIPNWADVF